ncbi:MAG: hypothetical protein OQL17_04835 [Sedimenticola sp.]|nr:hypothetical protein [Sedimenticola sp.]MCW8921563.1 hypothetical protein [Sedimenticola sp.]MCW8947647.1 hypothetical protein [Sedimenticola sp.]MCW8949289.1 hypothetical protein [Sedimenticola sp.]MCW8974307.1 hypothetical protein [Sedimenticola sp.]
MYTRHNEVPIYEHRAGLIEAAHYNRVKTAFKRLGREIRLVIPRLKTLDLILQQDAWIIVDRAFNDLPIAAWLDFEVAQRDALHTAVHCQLRLFHANADVVIKRALEAMELILEERLANAETTHQVLNFSERK